jgi:hypothetical protein
MKGLPKAILALIALTVGGSTASATVALELVAGAGPNYSTLFIDSTGAVTCSNFGTSTACTGSYAALASGGAITLGPSTFDGYHLSVTSGGSNSPTCDSFPNGPGCLNTTNITATNIGLGTATISAYFADTGFMPGGGVTGLTVGFSTPGETGTTAVQTAYATSGAINPLGIGVLNPTVGLTACGLPNLTITGPTLNTSTGTNCAVPGAPFSLELATTMTTGVGGSFNLNGTISAIPEPASVALFGSVLVFCASRLRRRKA